MFPIILTSIFSFISTNIDDIFVLMLFFAQEDQPGRKRQITLGQYLGIGTLVLISMAGAGLLQLVGQRCIGLLGFVPIALGIREWIAWRKNSSTDDEETEHSESGSSLVISVMLISIANGADNLGVYIPLFAGYSFGQMLVVLAVFTVLVALWCLLAQRITSLPLLRTAIQKYRHLVVPLVFVALGLYILAENFL